MSGQKLILILPQDRENVDVIAHELAHSWSGNLVSNASWEHFWLNEGWTMYLERRVCKQLTKFQPILESLIFVH